MPECYTIQECVMKKSEEELFLKLWRFWMEPEENISLKMGLPNIFSGSNIQNNSTNEEASQEDVEAFF